MAASFRALFEQLAPAAEPHPEAKSRPRPVAPNFGALAELLTPVAPPAAAVGEPEPAPKKPAPLKPGRIRMSTRGRPWRKVAALAWAGDLFVHVDPGDEDLFTIT